MRNVLTAKQTRVMTVLTAKQTQVMNGVLAEEQSRRWHLVVSISGAHAYGFPSPDSDIDLKAIHAVPTRELLGLGPAPGPAERLEVIDGVEIDYSSNELHGVLRSILLGNGNYIERVLGHLQPHTTAELQALRPLVKAALSRKIYRHYLGFGRSQLQEWEKGGFRSAKKLLYVLRTTLTGVHALNTGEIVTDLTALMDALGFGEARALIEQKTRGEKSELPETLAEVWKGRTTHAFALLDEAHATSKLPEVPAAKSEAALDDWLLELRRARM